jgi:hypothetical protein
MHAFGVIVFFIRFLYAAINGSKFGSHPWGRERASVEKATYRTKPLRLYHIFAPWSAHIALPRILRVEASASRMEQGMARRVIRVPETHIVGMVYSVA